MSVEEYAKEHDQMEAPPICRTAPYGRDCVNCGESDTDHFIDEKIQSQIDGGDTWLSQGLEKYYADPGYSNDEVKILAGIAKYLKALVLIESEKLRRGK